MILSAIVLPTGGMLPGRLLSTRPFDVVMVGMGINVSLREPPHAGALSIDAVVA